MEALLCAENSSPEGPVALEDPALLNNPKVLERLLALQYSTMPTQDYLQFIQTDIEPFMRKLVSTWMLEVCEEQGCEDQVFGVAMNFLDRFLCTTVVQRSQLQLVGAVCLLLASKIRQCRSLSVELLAYYTENSVSYQEIKKWELVLLSKLGWDLSPVTAGDFLDHLLVKIPDASRDPLTRRHASTFIALAATEPVFVQVEPSAVAVGALVAAVRGLRSSHWRDTLALLSAAVEGDQHSLEEVVRLIEETIERESSLLPDTKCDPQQQQQQHTPHNPTTASESEDTLLATPPTTPTSKHHQQTLDSFDGNETPTDVTDIMF